MESDYDEHEDEGAAFDEWHDNRKDRELTDRPNPPPADKLLVEAMTTDPMREAFSRISLAEADSTTSAAEKVRDMARIARAALEWSATPPEAASLRAALTACLPFIDDANEITTMFPESAASNACRAAVKMAHDALDTPPEAAASVQGGDERCPHGVCTRIRCESCERAKFLQFLTDVVTAAGLVEHGKQSKALAERISTAAMAYRIATPVVQGEPVAVSDQRIRDEITRVSGYQWWEIDAVEVVSSRRMMLIARALLDMPTSGERDL